MRAPLVVTALAFAAAPSASPQARPVEVYEATITELQAAMHAGRVTSVQLVEAYLRRIEAYDHQGPALNALIRLNPRARAEAAALDAERRERGSRGPLHGIPVILKDNYDTADLPTTGGLLALAGLTPPRDAFVVGRLREAGAVILGKANLHELAAGITTVSSLGGQTRNPYDPRRCPGGSSGGTGAAVAASFAAVGWGTDTCGSIRIPAAYGSLFGLRPSEGLVSRAGILPLSHTQDTGGPLARTAMDLAIAMDVTVGPDSADPVTSALRTRPVPRFADSLRADALAGARVGVLTNYFQDSDPDVIAVVRAALADMKRRGAEIVDVTIPAFDSLMARSRAVDYETKFDLVDYLARVPEAPVKGVGDIMATGLHLSALGARLRRIDSAGVRDSEAYRAALAKRSLIRNRIVALLDSLRLDALAYPTMRRRPALIGEPQPGGTCELSAHTGLPALSLPAGFTADGLPVGLELLGRPFADARLLAMAYSFEQAGARRRPPLTTPALVGGKAPGPIAIEVSARSADGPRPAATGRFTFDPARLELAYDVRTLGLQPDRVLAIVLQRAASDSVAGSVVQRLAGPGLGSARGTLALPGTEVQALIGGELWLALFTVDRPLGAARGRLVWKRIGPVR
ncbi:MAG TPA: amidase family protein [Gemmatimonadales bacterium]|nr:amidase family protein [Gemmatimonadales bacterium]